MVAEKGTYLYPEIAKMVIFLGTITDKLKNLPKPLIIVYFAYLIICFIWIQRSSNIREQAGFFERNETKVCSLFLKTTLLHTFVLFLRTTFLHTFVKYEY